MIYISTMYMRYIYIDIYVYIYDTIDLGPLDVSLSKDRKSVHASSAFNPSASNRALVVCAWKPRSNSLIVMVPLPS